MQHKKYSIKLNGRTIIVKKPLICSSILSQMRGLMFRRAGFKTPLLFVWKKAGKYPIHSFFCRKFLAVWFIDGKIIEKKVVKPWRIHVCPAGKFNSLLEIPIE